MKRYDGYAQLFKTLCINHIDAFAAEALSYRNHDKLRGGKIMEHGRLRRIALVTA